MVSETTYKYDETGSLIDSAKIFYEYDDKGNLTTTRTVIYDKNGKKIDEQVEKHKK